MSIKYNIFIEWNIFIKIFKDFINIKLHMSIPYNRKLNFLSKIGGESRIKNCQDMMLYFDKIYQINDWDTSTVERIKTIMNEDIGESLNILFHDHKSWNVIYTHNKKKINIQEVSV